MKIGGICSECGKYYRGGACANPDCVIVSSGQTINVINDVPEHYNRGIGKVIRGRAQYNAELRKNGLIEVGNEKGYVSPEHQEKLQERKTEVLYGDLREKAYQMMGRSEARWN